MRSLLHSGVTVRGYYLLHALGASVPLVAGIALFGWRAAASVGAVLASTLIALLAWRTIGSRGRQVQPAKAIWMALLVGLMLPPHLASTAAIPSLTHSLDAPAWPVLAAAGFSIVILLWLAGGVGAGRFHAGLYTYLTLVALFWAMLQPHWVLARKHLGRGDILQAPTPGLLAPSPEPWLDRPPEVGFDAFWTAPASQALSQYTRGELKPEHGRLPLHELLRDKMPPMEDLVVGGHPAPIGCASLIAVIVGGLFLLYRGLIDFRIPLLIVVSMYIALMVLPIPTVLTEKGAYFRWMILREPDVRWETAVTFVHYQLAAGPAVFMAFFVATAPGIRPLARRARALYALLIGLLAAAGQLYVSVAIGPYLALMCVALIAPVLDRWFSPKTLV